MRIILLTGGPGSGKSTQGSLLMAKNAKLKHLSLGDVVRNCLKDVESPITKNYQEVIKSGNLLPDELIFSILEQDLKKIQDQDVIVLLDGYPRSEAQYELFKSKWGMPDALIHLDIDEATLSLRMLSRKSDRSDDNEQAIKKRLSFYQETTKPLIEKIKSDLQKNAITVGSQQSAKSTGLYLYATLQRINSIHTLLNNDAPVAPKNPVLSPAIKSISRFSILSQWWRTGMDESAAIEAIQKNNNTHNFSFSMLGRQITYLETAEELSAVLRAQSTLGQVYHQFSLAAGLKNDFVATNSHIASTYRLPNHKVNIWKLIHTSLSEAIRDDKLRIEHLIDKYLNHTFLAEKTFDLDIAFDTFFTSFWSEYLLGDKISPEIYQDNRQKILSAMKYCFYGNKYKGLDPTGLSSYFYSYAVSAELKAAKDKIKGFITKATPSSLVQRFQSILEKINDSEHLDLDKRTINEIIADNVFDLFFEPDFLENVIYESLVSAIQENADFRQPNARNKVYNEGMQNGYLFPIRARVLTEPVILADGSVLPSGSMVYLNMKKAELYHSAGPRRCVGQAYTKYFKDHLFNCLEPIEFKVKSISYPKERQSTDKNVPISPERYTVSWRLKRDEAMRHLSSHNYKGQHFFDVLSLYQKPALNDQIVTQLTLKIMRQLQKRRLDLKDIVIVTSEVRGIPVASQVAAHLKLPMYIIRKKGGYKMSDDEVYSEAYNKGYGDPDVIELPKEQIKSLTGKKIIFLDDGLASGQSAIACIKLLEKKSGDAVEPAHVIMVMTLLKHDYVATNPRLSEHCLVKTLFDCKAKPAALGHNLVPESGLGLVQQAL